MSKNRKSYLIASALACLTIAGCQVSNTGTAQLSDKQAESNSGPDLSPAPSVLPAIPALLSPSTNKAQCKLDLVSGAHATINVTLEHGSGAAFEGWAFIKGESVPQSLYLVFKGTDDHNFAVPVKSGINRDDVVQAFNDPSLERSGFSVTADISKLPIGSYRLSLRSPSPNTSVDCDLATHVQVTK